MKDNTCVFIFIYFNEFKVIKIIFLHLFSGNKFYIAFRMWTFFKNIFIKHQYEFIQSFKCLILDGIIGFWLIFIKPIIKLYLIALRENLVFCCKKKNKRGSPLRSSFRALTFPLLEIRGKAHDLSTKHKGLCEVFLYIRL